MTLVEMLVTIAVLVIVMTILVQIFQAATGAVTAAQAYQAIDDQLRRIDGILRADLGGATAQFTPPLDPALNLGYFEYAENEFADNQGEDCDDYIRFTAKAPEGRPFTGRMWVNPWFNATLNQTFGDSFQIKGTNVNTGSFPVTVTSDYAEIIYFLRNGNLYRRVLLVAPQLQNYGTSAAFVPAINNTGYSNVNGTAITTVFQPSILGGPPNGSFVSWQGVNDLSAHPAPSGPNSNTTVAAYQQAQTGIVLNTLGHLTNRENRPFYARYGNDFYNANTQAAGPDGIPDDVNQDNYPDLYPSLYPNLYSSTTVGLGAGLINAPSSSATYTTGVQQFLNSAGVSTGINFLAFPYVFPGAYSRAQALATDQYGWIHAPSPYANANGTLVRFDTAGLTYLNALNHNPLDLGDNLPTPVNPRPSNETATVQPLQTWWGFPTWRETLSPHWTDPTVQVNVGPVVLANNGVSPATPWGLSYAELNVSGGAVNFGNAFASRNLLPPTVTSWTNGANTINMPVLRNADQLFSDFQGMNSQLLLDQNGNLNTGLWAQSWEDDLILTGVRSFDVKAFEPVLGTYADLGWGDDIRMYVPYQNAAGGGPFGLLLTNVATGAYTASNFNPLTVLPTSLFLAGTPPRFYWPPVNPNPAINPPTSAFNPYNTLGQTFAHEGRMPPLTTDHVFDAQSGAATNYLSPFSTYVQNGYTGNVGDNTSGIVRLRRVWDSWSTDYSRAPRTGPSTLNNGFPAGWPLAPPIYPSYPPPYPAPLRGIQIQIRVVDPSNQRIKSLTIRQDFTDKLGPASVSGGQ